MRVTLHVTLRQLHLVEDRISGDHRRFSIHRGPHLDCVDPSAMPLQQFPDIGLYGEPVASDLVTSAMMNTPATCSVRTSDFAISCNLRASVTGRVSGHLVWAATELLLAAKRLAGVVLALRRWRAYFRHDSGCEPTRRAGELAARQWLRRRVVVELEPECRREVRAVAGLASQAQETVLYRRRSVLGDVLPFPQLDHRKRRRGRAGDPYADYPVQRVQHPLPVARTGHPTIHGRSNRCGDRTGWPLTAQIRAARIFCTRLLAAGQRIAHVRIQTV